MNSDYFKTISKIIQQGSLIRLRTYSKRPEFKIDSVESPRQVLGHWMSIILLSGPSVRVTLKVHFMTNVIKQIVSEIFNGDTTITEDEAKDFVREFSNLTCAFIKQQFEAQSIKCGMSLPIVISGFDEIFSKVPDQKYQFDEIWSLTDGTFQIICSCNVEILNSENLSNLKYLENLDSSFKEFEYL